MDDGLEKFHHIKQFMMKYGGVTFQTFYLEVLAFFFEKNAKMFYISTSCDEQKMNLKYQTTNA